MPTALTKTVTRRSESVVRDGTKRRRLVVSIHPGGFIGMRLEKTRREETIDFESVWSMAVKMRVAHEKAQRKASRTASRGR